MASQKTGSLFFLATLVLALCLSGRLVGEPDAAGGTPSRDLAVISLAKVLKAHEGMRKVEEEIGAYLREGEAELARLGKELETLNDELMVYAPDSKEYQDGKSEMERKELLLKQRKRELLLERDYRMSQGFKAAYGDVERAVKEYAAAHGIKAVLSYGVKISEVNSNRLEEIIDLVSSVNTVWHDDQLDISEAIITIINGS